MSGGCRWCGGVTLRAHGFFTNQMRFQNDYIGPCGLAPGGRLSRTGTAVIEVCITSSISSPDTNNFEHEAAMAIHLKDGPRVIERFG